LDEASKFRDFHGWEILSIAPGHDSVVAEKRRRKAICFEENEKLLGTFHVDT
jgi:hypothetical protein